MKRRRDLEPSSVECMWIEIRYSMSPSLLVGFIYINSASTDWYDTFTHMMDSVNSNSRNILLLGNFNFNLLEPQPEWESTAAQIGLNQLVSTATRSYLH